MARGIALNIGVNAVDPMHYAGWQGDLIAPEADAIDMERIARSSNFSTKALLTHEATRSRVIDEISQASDELKPNDIFMLTYSGNGGVIPGPSTLSPTLQLTTWCLYGAQLVEHEIYKLLAGFKKGVRILIFSDPCHSATVTRVVVSANKMVPQARVKCMPLAVGVRTYRQNIHFYEQLAEALGPKSVKDKIKASVLWFSGCQENQLSYDGDFNGLFTTEILRIWRDGSFKGDYWKFLAEIQKQMPGRQMPHLVSMGTVSTAFSAQRPFTI